jgi:hypothetical protein
MTQADPKNEAMKQALKEALAETLHEQRGLLHEVFAEVLEDFAFAEAIREGRQTERVQRDFGDELVPFSVPRPTPYASNARQQAGLHAENGTVAKQVREREHELEEAKRALKEERREVEHLREINAALETKVMSSPAGVEGLM